MATAESSSNDANHEVRSLLEGAVPERKNDVDLIMDQIDFRRATDKDGIYLQATVILGRGLVVFTDRTMQQVWLVSYLAWQALREEVGPLLVSIIKREDLSAHQKADRANRQEIPKTDRLAQALRDLCDSSPGILLWPDDVPTFDEKLSQLRDQEDKAAYDLTVLAAAFIFLHEVSHVKLREADEMEGGIEEELACDEYAANMLLANHAEFYHSQEVGKMGVGSKRAMGVFLGLLLMLEATEEDRWRGSESHPAIALRIRKCLDVIICHADVEESFWIYGSCALLSKLRRHDRLSTELGAFENAKELFDQLLIMLDS